MGNTKTGWGAILLAGVITLLAYKIGVDEWVLLFIFFATALGIVMVKVGD